VVRGVVGEKCACNPWSVPIRTHYRFPTATWIFPAKTPPTAQADATSPKFNAGWCDGTDRPLELICKPTTPRPLLTSNTRFNKPHGCKTPREYAMVDRPWPKMQPVPTKQGMPSPLTGIWMAKQKVAPGSRQIIIHNADGTTYHRRQPFLRFRPVSIPSTPCGPTECCLPKRTTGSPNPHWRTTRLVTYPLKRYETGESALARAWKRRRWPVTVHPNTTSVHLTWTDKNPLFPRCVAAYTPATNCAYECPATTN
jgi:hypothetical protein